MIFKKFRIDQLFTVDTSNTYGSNLKDTPDFIIGKNPSRYEILYQLNAKRHALYSREYMLCKNCFLQDYDQARKMPEKCPVCGSDNVELIIEEE